MSNLRSQTVRVLAASALAALVLAGCGGGSSTPDTSKRCAKHPQWKVCKGKTASTTTP